MPRVLLALLVAVFSPRCPPIPAGLDAGPMPVDGAPGPSDPCGAAYAHMQMLQCPPTGPLGDAGTWADACRNARGHGIDLHTACRIQAADCAAVTACER
jgi:hypothetical protein